MQAKTLYDYHHFYDGNNDKFYIYGIELMDLTLSFIPSSVLNILFILRQSLSELLIAHSGL